jgi:anti-repressor protein
MNELQNFDFAGKVVRVVMIDGEPWWIARDVCIILDISNVSDAVLKLDIDEKLVSVLPIAGQNREVNLINESGLYTLILRSNKPEAKGFRKWVTAIVLPQIRKTGSYNQPKELTRKDLALMVVQAEEELEKANFIIREQQPKVALAEKCLIATNLQSMLDASKLLKVGRTKLFSFLRYEMILRKDNTPYQRFLEAGYFEVKLSSITMGEKVVNKTQTFVTPKGLNYIRERFEAANMSIVA